MPDFHKDELFGVLVMARDGGGKWLSEMSLWMDCSDRGTLLSILPFKEGGISAILDCAHQVRPIPTIE
jgi:hypothetical protein